MRWTCLTVSLLCVSACTSPKPEARATNAAAVAPSSPLRATVRTAQVPNDPDDPAIWIHPNDPARSLIVATDKREATGGLYVFGFDGIQRQTIAPLDRPNNVDIEYGVRIGGTLTDIAVVTERKRRCLRVFAIDPASGSLSDVVPAGLPVLAGAEGAAGEPMGIGLYRRPSDGAVFAIVAPKTGAATDYLWQYRLADDGQGLRATFVRRFGTFSGLGPVPGEAGEVEAVVVDDELGYVYYADERFGLRKWAADPDSPEAGKELATLGLDGYQGDREGLAILDRGNGTGYLVSSDQVTGGTRLHVYPREGHNGHPHEQPRLAIIPTESDETDGLEVTPRAVPGFPDGALVMMNSASRNFLIYDWRIVAERIHPATQR